MPLFSSCGFVFEKISARKLGRINTRSPQLQSLERPPSWMKHSQATEWSPGDRPTHCAGDRSAAVDKFLARVGQLERGEVGSSSWQWHNCPCQGCQSEVLWGPCLEFVGRTCGWTWRWPGVSGGSESTCAWGLWGLTETGPGKTKGVRRCKAWQDFSTRLARLFGYQGWALGMMTQNTLLELNHDVENRWRNSGTQVSEFGCHDRIELGRLLWVGV